MSELLTIPITFEDMSQEMKGDMERLAQIIQPVMSAEETINVVLSAVKNSGYLLFFLGPSGVGKSTFISSLRWRSHIRKRDIININFSEIMAQGGLPELFKEISKISGKATKEKELGPTIIVIDYLESIDDFEEKDVKGFFRNLNGLIRKTPILVLWPVTSADDANSMADLAKTISTTMFHADLERIDFAGPGESSFADIAKRTITFLNNGKEPTEFGITNDTFEEIKRRFATLPAPQRTIRKYLQLLKTEWERINEYLKRLKLKIPKPIEVWFIFSYVDAESVVSQFSRKGQSVEETWTPYHDKLYEYIPDSQRSAIWNATRLQLALFGYIKTRIMFLPTNALIAVLLSYATEPKVLTAIEKHKPPKHWRTKTVAKTFLRSSPLYKQVLGERYQVGLRKGGPVAQAMKISAPIFSTVSKLISKGNISDTVYNKSLAECLREMSNLQVHGQQPHPWLKKIVPDITIELPEKTISIELHYTDDDAPYKIAHYVLNKLNTYMNQIEEISQ